VEHLPRFAGSFNSRTMATCDLRAEMNDALADLFATKRDASADDRERMVQRQLANRGHYLEAKVPEQFDHHVWFGRTTAVRALARRPDDRPPDTYPFGI
jgi:erythromycin esterase-like protein